MSSEQKKPGKLWEGRTSGATGDALTRIGASIDLDIELYREDIRGSRAHAKMLAKIGILKSDELDKIDGGLIQIQKEIESGNFKIQIELEDIHTHVENRLTEIIGETAGKLHTARSRNDQIAVDTHLFVRRISAELFEGIHRICTAFLTKAIGQIDTVLPGYTHMQVAQPIRLSHHLLAHFWGFLRDAERFQRSFEIANVLPLGAGALAGTNYPTDREFIRTELGFASMYENSMDAVATRDHIQEFLYACASFSVRASRFAEEVILWNSVEFGFIKLKDSVTTGSSIMPQKKNPDLAELIRGKAGRLTGNLTNLFMNLKGLPFTYNRDLQEDRHPLLDTARNAELIVEGLIELIDGIDYQQQNLTKSLDAGYATATDLADALVMQKNIPFREAHHIAGKLVGECANKSIFLKDASVTMRSAIHASLAEDEFYFKAIDAAASTDKKISRGGTARVEQLKQIEFAKAAIADAEAKSKKLKSLTDLK